MHGIKNGKIAVTGDLARRVGAGMRHGSPTPYERKNFRRDVTVDGVLGGFTF
jgi:hypothetical protein